MPSALHLLLHNLLLPHSLIPRLIQNQLYQLHLLLNIIRVCPHLVDLVLEIEALLKRLIESGVSARERIHNITQIINMASS